MIVHTQLNGLFYLLKNALKEWNLSLKDETIFKVITDNGSNIAKSFRESKMYLFEENEDSTAITSTENKPEIVTDISLFEEVSENVD